jgi:hypothetical protein
MDHFTASIMQLRSGEGLGSRVAKFVFPFVKTPSNIVKQGVEYSPVGWSTLIGAENKTEQAAKALMGTAVFATAYMALESGRVTWAEPTSQKKKTAFKEAGMQPYAIKIGNSWVAFNKLPPGLAFPFALTAGLKDAEKNGILGADQISNILEGVANTTNFYADQSYLKSVGDTMAGLKGDKDRLAQVPANFGQQVVPFRALTGWFARLTDEVERQANPDAGFFQKQGQLLAQNYPGLREQTPARLGSNGAPMPSNNQVFNSFSPIRITGENAEGARLFADLNQKTVDNRNKKVATEIQAKASGVDTKTQSRINEAKKTITKGVSKQSEDTLVNYAKLDTEGKKKFNADPKNKYNLELAKFENDVKAGKLNDVQKQSKEKSLAKMAITKDYSKEVVDFYGLSNADKNLFFKRDPQKAKALYDQAKELAAKLDGKGLPAKTVSTATKAKKGTKAKGSGGKTARAKKGKSSYAKFSVVGVNTSKNVGALRALVQKPKYTRKAVKK